MTEENKEKFNMPTWLNSVLITILIIVAGASFFQNKKTQNSVDTLQISMAILNEKITTNIDVSGETQELVEDNTKRITALEIDRANYITQAQYLARMEEFHQYVMNNYERKK